MRALNSVAALMLLCSVCSFPSHCQTDCLRRTAIVNVVDEHGYAITGLTRERFRVVYRHKVISPSNLQYSFGPRRVVVLLDTSGSMTANLTGNTFTWQTARAAAWSLISSLPAGSKSSLITFSTKPEIRTVLSTERKASLDWLNSGVALNPKPLGGRTGLFTAVQAGLSQLQPTEPGDAIYLITDAGENASTTTGSAVDHNLRLENVRLFALIVPPMDFFPGEQQRDAETLWYLCKRTGGSVYVVDALNKYVVYDERIKQQVETLSQQVSKRISAFYSLSVDLPENPTKVSKWEVELLDEQNRNWKKAVLSYPTEVLPCTTASR